MKTHFQIDYVDLVSGESHSHDTTSKFIAQKLIANVMDFAIENKVPLYKTKLKVTAYRKHCLQCAVTIGAYGHAMMRFTLYYN